MLSTHLVALLISPLGTSLLLGLLALVLAGRRHPRLAVATASIAIAWLWAWSTPAVSFALRSRIENQQPDLPATSLPRAEAIVVLGGTVAPPSTRGASVDLQSGSDRVWHAARLFSAGKAPLILLSGGSDMTRVSMSEAEAMREFLRALAVPDSAMVLESRSRNTRQNAAFSAPLLKQRGIRHILLVTSALHMTRARSEFERQGIEVTAAATDFEAASRTAAPWAFLPDAGALEGSARVLKELVGQWVACRGPCPAYAGSAAE